MSVTAPISASSSAKAEVTAALAAAAASDAKSVAPGQGSAANASGDNTGVGSTLARCRQQRSVPRSVLNHTLGAIRDAAPAQREELLIKKIRLCCYIFNYSDAGAAATSTEAETLQDTKDKELKRLALLELVNYLTVAKPSFNDRVLAEIFEMLACNLFRPLPPSSLEATGQYNPEEDEPQSEASWPHLQVVYEFLLRLATSTETDAKLLDRYFNKEFILNVLELFDSEDPRERDYLKTILHRIYGNFMALRPFIRSAINNVFFRFVYETDRHNGISELLEILGSIINGFALPLKDQHKEFLQRVLLPLHKVTYVSVFHPQLSYCVTQFLEKDPSLAPGIVRSLLKFWPLTSSKKELMFLNELEEILDRIQSTHLAQTQIPLFRQISKSIQSPHFQVSERAIYVLNNDAILRFIANNRQTLVPILCKALYSNTHLAPGLLAAAIAAAQAAANPSAAATASDAPVPPTEPEAPLTGPRAGATVPAGKKNRTGHWNPTIVELTKDILKLFTEMDAELMDKCQTEFNGNVKTGPAAAASKKAKWDSLTPGAGTAASTPAPIASASAATNAGANVQVPPSSQSGKSAVAPATAAGADKK